MWFHLPGDPQDADPAFDGRVLFWSFSVGAVLAVALVGFAVRTRG